MIPPLVSDPRGCPVRISVIGVDQPGDAAKVEGQQDGPVTGICGDGDPVAGVTVHSHTGSWDVGGWGG